MQQLRPPLLEQPPQSPQRDIARAAGWRIESGLRSETAARRHNHILTRVVHGSAALEFCRSLEGGNGGGIRIAHPDTGYTLGHMSTPRNLLPQEGWNFHENNNNAVDPFPTLPFLGVLANAPRPSASPFDCSRFATPASVRRSLLELGDPNGCLTWVRIGK